MLNKLILRAFLSISIVLSSISLANATLITQDIIDSGELIGSISINTDNAVTFDVDSYVGEFVSFNLFGFELLDFTDFELDNPLFEASFDGSDLNTGILSLDFDITDVFGAFYWSGSIWSESLGADFNYLDVFDGEDILLFTTDVTLGSVSVVPLPASFILFLTAIAVLISRRKML
jgi:hypothetical protein